MAKRKGKRPTMGYREPAPPVYYSALRLFKQLRDSTAKTSINDKRGMIADIEGYLDEAMVASIRAYRKNCPKKSRIAFVNCALDNIDSVVVRVRILADKHVLKEQGFDALWKIEGEILSQLQSWKSSCENEQETNV